jgi:phosphohistidine swiveling domain-containing protein
MNRYILDLDSRTATRQAYSGGKGTNLARLRKQGARVPPGFVITPAAFREMLLACGLEQSAGQRSWTRDEAQYVRELLLVSPVPEHLVWQIGRAYRRLGGRVAVRSSMVGEDSSGASFAGQLDTVLNVEGTDRVLEAVKRCWASTFGWRQISYWDERGNHSPDARYAVPDTAIVVQRMVDAQAAGVAFGADPVTGQRIAIIEATQGLGDTLVRGLVEPERHVVDARGELVQTWPVGEAEPVLQEEQVLGLARLVRRINRWMRSPQDVEWAWDGEHFYVLQSRPITSLTGKHIYSNSMVSEMLPGLIKPLVWSVSVQSKLENVLGRVFDELIGPADEEQIDYSLLARRFHSRIYADNTVIGRLLERMGMPVNAFEMMSRDEQAARHRMPLNLRTMRAMWRMARFVWRHARITDAIEAHIARHDRDLERFRRATWTQEQDPLVLLCSVEQLIELYSQSMWYNFIGPIHMMVRRRWLDRIVGQRAPDVATEDLLRGLVGLKSIESNRGIQALADQARALDEDVLDLMASGSDPGIREALAALPTNAAGDLLRQVDGFLQEYGFLSVNGTDFSQTPWIENPTMIWHAIGSAARQPERSGHVESQESVSSIRDRAQETVRARTKGIHRLLFDRLLASTIAYVDLRERSSFALSEKSFQMRRLFLALGRHLIARGELDQPDDVFYLTLEEVQQLFDGASQTGSEQGSARERVAARRAEMEADARLELPDTFCGDQAPACSIWPEEPQDILSGIAGSSGRVEGRARIVVDPAQAALSYERQDILVVPFTDVSWTPLFVGIGGVIAETGGQLSHSAIIAREYGLPAVVNVKNATRLIREGQTVIVDGTRGKVYLQTDVSDPAG